VIREATTGEFADLAGFRANFSEPQADLVLRVWRNGRVGDLPMR
jgi:hypothetical protein